jgi:hypothetical protein
MPKKGARMPKTQEKSQLLLRFDEDVHAAIRNLAESAQVSVNQLMQGLARWAVKNATVGEPIRDANGVVSTTSQVGCLWFGKTGCYLSAGEVEQIAFHYACSPSEINKVEKGEVWGVLDFTERRVIRDFD